MSSFIPGAATPGGATSYTPDAITTVTSPFAAGGTPLDSSFFKDMILRRLKRPQESRMVEPRKELSERRQGPGATPELPLGAFLEPGSPSFGPGAGSWILDRTKITPEFMRQYGKDFGGYF